VVGRRIVRTRHEDGGVAWKPERVLDLTHTLTPEFPLYPVYDPVTVRDKFSVADDGFFVRSWTFDEHSGTHVDAPAHFGGDATVDRIEVSDLVLEAVVVDVRDRVAKDDDALVGPDDVLAWESAHGALPERCALLALTGWGARAGDGAAYLNADAAGVMHTPGFSPELAAFLADERPGVRAVGLDTASLDFGPSSDFGFHSGWLQTGRYGIENLARLDDLPPRGALLVVGAPKLQAGSGGPSRILALL
jgi:kynurenine formamidase